MADIRVRVADGFIDALKATLQLESYADVVQEALTLLNWAAEEKLRGRLLLSTDQKGEQVERLAMPSLSIIQASAPKAAAAGVPTVAAATR